VQEQQSLIEKQNQIIETLQKENEETKARLNKIETLLITKQLN
jgi:hypothetical protein